MNFFLLIAVSTLSRSGTPVNNLPKLPPIITSEIDRAFLLDLNDYIKYETDKLSPGDYDQRYTIYKSVFNKVRCNTEIRYIYKGSLGSGSGHVSLRNRKSKEPFTLRK